MALSLLATFSGFGPVGASLPQIAVESLAPAGQIAVPVTFGQAFGPGDLPAGFGLTGSIDGVDVALQLDAKTRHPDGSLRHAVLTLELDSLPAGAVESVVLAPTPSPPTGGAILLGDVLASGFDATAEVVVQGTTFVASARTLLMAQPPAWLQGAIVAEWDVAGPLIGPGGLPHPHLAVRFAIRAYAGLARIRVDTTIENGWAYQAGPRNFTYDVTLRGAGTLAFTRNGLTHYRQARWRKVFWVGVEPQLAIRPDARYLMSIGALPPYQAELVVPEAAISELAASWAGAAVGPMGAGLTNPYMPTTGSRPDIAPLPQWTARYLLSRDSRVAPAVFGSGDLAGSWGIHYRDKSTGLPVTLDDHPEMTLLAAGYGFDDFPPCSGDCATPFEPDSSHQPSLSYLPYLLTGDVYHLDELHFWANWNMLRANPAYRGYELGLLHWDQVRGQAWSMRTLGHAAYVTPDTHPLKSYFESRLENNLAWYHQRYSAAPGDAPSLRFIDNGYAIRPGGILAPWEDDFFTAMVAWIRDLGFASAGPLTAWKVGFVVGRFAHDPEYCRHDGAVYEVTVVDPATNNYVDEWGRLLELSFPSHVGACPSAFNTYVDATDGYLAHARAALAAAVDSGHPEMAAQLTYLVAAQQAGGADYAYDPAWALAPRGRPQLFSDGFESADTAAWSGAFP